MAGAKRVIAAVTLGSAQASITFSSIPQTYRHLELVLVGRGDAAATNAACQMQFNGDTGANYDRQTLRGVGSSAAAYEDLGGTNMRIGSIPAATATAGVSGGLTSTVFDYARTSWQKAVVSQMSLKVGTSTSNFLADLLASFWRNTNAVTSITIFLDAGNFDAGTKAILCGLKGAGQ